MNADFFGDVEFLSSRGIEGALRSCLASSVEEIEIGPIFLNDFTSYRNQIEWTNLFWGWVAGPEETAILQQVQDRLEKKRPGHAVTLEEGYVVVKVRVRF